MSLWPSLLGVAVNPYKNMLKNVMCTKLNIYILIFRIFMYFQSTKKKKKSFLYSKSFTPYILLTYKQLWPYWLVGKIILYN